MPRINLLPWRDEQRKERKLAFFVALGGAALGALVAAFVGYLMFKLDDRRPGAAQRPAARRDQDARQADRGDQRPRDARSRSFIARMEIIEKLQRSRPEIVHVFDEIVRTLPDGIYLTAVKQNGKQAQVRRRRAVDRRACRPSCATSTASQWLKNPELEVVQTSKGSGRGLKLHADRRARSTHRGDDGRRQPAAKCRKRRACAGSAPMNLLEELRSLDPRDPGRWPLPVRAGAVAVWLRGR